MKVKIKTTMIEMEVKDNPYITSDGYTKMTKIKLPKEFKEVLVNNGNMIQTKEGERFYYMPFWFKELEEGELHEVVDFDNLPVALKREIQTAREFTAAIKKDFPLIPKDCIK